MGCDEYHPGAVTGPLSVAITASFTSVAVGFPVNLTALIDGRADLSVWAFEDGTIEINEPYVAHAWSAPGDYPVSLWAYNDSHPGGVSATLTIHVVAGIYYVATGSANPAAPYTSWATAATNIQDAVNVVSVPGAQVLVTNGTYAPYRAYGGPLGLTVRSVNGAQFTIIDGGHSNQCASLSSDASLSGFTLTNGASQYGAGASGGTLSNCVLSGNSAYNGGGAGGCTLNNCTLIGNSASNLGGGASDCTLINCTLTGNTANTNYNSGSGGGAYGCTLQNCTLAGNAAFYGGGAYHGTLTNCMLSGNLAYDGGGGANYCTLNNCTLDGNSATRGGGVMCCTLNNCRLSVNSAPDGAAENTK